MTCDHCHSKRVCLDDSAYDNWTKVLIYLCQDCNHYSYR